MFKKRVIVLINTDEDYWLKTEKIWFWKSKKEYLNDMLYNFCKEKGNKRFTNIQMY